VLGTGQPISTFLSDQYELYQEEAESKQQQYLELLSTFAEAYVTALVAGPLFFITILVVIGLVLEDTLPCLRVVVYLGVPLATFGFVVYVDSVTQGIGGTETVDLSEAIEDESGMSDTASAQADGNPQPDGGVAGGSPSADRWAASRERLRAYDRIRTLRRWAASPVESVLGARTVFLLSVPLAVVVLLVTAFPITLGPPTEMVAQVETPIVAATVVVLASYAVVYEAPQAPSPPDRVGGSRLSRPPRQRQRGGHVRGRERPARRGLEPGGPDRRPAAHPARHRLGRRRRGHRSPAARATSPIADDLAGGRAHHERDACQRRCRPRAPNRGRRVARDVVAPSGAPTGNAHVPHRDLHLLPRVPRNHRLAVGVVHPRDRGGGDPRCRRRH